MADRPAAGRGPLAAADDPTLEAALEAIGRDLDVPPLVPGLLASRVTARIVATGLARTRPAHAWRWPRLRRGVVLALVATILLTAVAAAAIGLDLPGLRILFGPPPSAPPTASPPPTPSASLLPGALLGLGTPLAVDAARDLLDFEIGLPAEPDLGPPDATYVRVDRVALVWAPRPDLPPTADPGVGLLLNEFRGSYDEVVVEKLVHEGTRVETVSVDGARGYWIDGAPHVFVYVGPDGTRLEDSYRSVGDTLVWTADGITYRLETGLGRDAAIRLAVSIR